jgi:hypothetical protein
VSGLADSHDRAERRDAGGLADVGGG